jgi:hypothetical protein
VNKYTTLLKAEGLLRDRDDGEPAIPLEERPSAGITAYEINERNEISAPVSARAYLDPAIVAEIRRIEPAALAQGWTKARLWESRGLAFVLDAGRHSYRRQGPDSCSPDKIEEVTCDFIVIRKHDGSRQRFRRTEP